MSLDWFPQDILEQIAENLDDVRDLNSLSRVCKRVKLTCKLPLIRRKTQYLVGSECGNVVTYTVAKMFEEINIQKTYWSVHPYYKLWWTMTHHKINESKFTVNYLLGLNDKFHNIHNIHFNRVKCVR